MRARAGAGFVGVSADLITRAAHGVQGIAGSTRRDVVPFRYSGLSQSQV